MLIEHHPRHLN
jgi:hypothetical protein